MTQLRTIPYLDKIDYDRDAARTIVAAAVLDTVTDKVYVIDRPARHYQIVHAMNEQLGLPQLGTHEQGFLTSDGYFLRRRPAFVVAERAEQLKASKTKVDGTLYSEDVW